jgi:hypothetical protein
MWGRDREKAGRPHPSWITRLGKAIDAGWRAVDSALPATPKGGLTSGE